MFQRVYRDNTILLTHVFEWQRFKEGCEVVKDDSKSRRPSTSKTEVNIEQVRQVVCGNCWLTMPMTASQLDIKKDSVWKIITEDLGMSEM